MAWNVVLILSSIWLLNLIMRKFISHQRARKVIGGCPGGEILWLHPFRNLSVLLGPFFPFGLRLGNFFAKFSIYNKYGSTCLSSIAFAGSIPIFWFSEPEAIKIISADRFTFKKDVEAYETLNIYGPNLVGTEGSDWRRHRRVSNPAFNEANNALVWSETIRIFNGWFTEIDASQHTEKGSVVIDLVKELTQEDSAAEIPPGHKMAFRPAVTSTLDYLFVKFMTPNWIHNLSQLIHIPYISPLLKATNDSFESLRNHMLEVVSLARAWMSGGKLEEMDAALLRNLVEANMAQETGYKSLTDDELLSNTFTFLLAGHETSAHTLSFAIALLALYPGVQQRVFEEAVKLWPGGVPSDAESSPYKQSMARLEYTTAVFYETLRHFPAVPRLAKPVHADTTLKARRFSPQPNGQSSTTPESQEFTVSIPAGSLVIVDILGVQTNPFVWGPDVEAFKPERFLDTDSYRWPRDGFLAFSAGPRSCIGQRFALTESVCILAALVRQYEILVPDDVQHLPWSDQQRELLHWFPRITLTPNNARVQLRRRC